MTALQALSPESLANLPPASKRELIALLEEKQRRQSLRQLLTYRPYAKQRDFHRAGSQSREVLLMAANQSGKTWAAGNEVAMHLSGQYPDWWEGRRFTGPNHWLAGSETAELTRRGVQRILLGRDIRTAIGTGTIPGESIVRVTPARGIADFVDTVAVRHVSGGISTISLKTYDQGRQRWQADTISGVWFDEEPPPDVYFEGLTRTNTTLGPVMMTFTPLQGMSDVVRRFVIEKPTGTCVVQMTIEDAEHYTPEQREQIIASYPEHERQARAKGIPVLGSGRIFPISEESLSFDLFKFPDHWPRISGMDFGWDHPTAAAWFAWDRDSDTTYLYDTYRRRRETPLIHAGAIKGRGEWIPMAWPADGLQTEKGTGVQLAEQYRDLGLNMLHEIAQLPEAGSTGETRVSRVSVEAGVSEMLQAMQEGRFKVARHLTDWWEEFRLYHRKDGKIVKVGEDLIDASRYGYTMRRYAVTKPAPRNRSRPPPNWRA